MQIVSTYAPPAPTPTPPPCEGAPWRMLDGAVQCLTDLPATGGVEGWLMLVGIALMVVGVAALVQRRRKSR